MSSSRMENCWPSLRSVTATAYDIWVLRLGDRKAQPFLRTPFGEADHGFPRRTLASVYLNETGRFEIYVQPYPGPGGKRQISTEAARSRCGTRTGGSCSTAAGTR